MSSLSLFCSFNLLLFSLPSGAIKQIAVSQSVYVDMQEGARWVTMSIHSRYNALTSLPSCILVLPPPRTTTQLPNWDSMSGWWWGWCNGTGQQPTTQQWWWWQQHQQGRRATTAVVKDRYLIGLVLYPVPTLQHTLFQHFVSNREGWVTKHSTTTTTTPPPSPTLCLTDNLRFKDE